jgi:diguanylate cyclase (GGDEF)-like protein
MRDQLTGLFSCNEFVERLREAMVVARPEDARLVVLWLDIKRFDRLNAALGFREGNRALADVAQALLFAKRAGDTLARLGGDEFGVLMPNTTLSTAFIHAQTLRDIVKATLARYVREACRSGREIFAASPPDRDSEERTDVPLTASVGVATRTPPAVTAEELLKNAEERSRLASREGGDLVWVDAPTSVQREAWR